MDGFIYVRTNEYFDTYNACKLGKTCNLAERHSQYKTSEIKQGKFEMVLKMHKTDSDICEKLLQSHFNNLGYHIYYDGGIEFYKKDIILLIIEYLQNKNISFIQLSQDEIEDISYKKLEDNKVENDESDGELEYSETITPKDYQKDIIDKSIAHFAANEKGILCITCGAGKTYISLWITKQLGLNKILVCVPNIALLSQWEKSIKTLFGYIYQVFTVSSNLDIKKVFECDKFFILTTYASVHKIPDFTFDMKILDECHHVTSKTTEKMERKQYIKALDIQARKQLSLTATMKIVESDTLDVVSNDNILHFGEVIYSLCLMDAIKLGIVCDYDILTILTNEEKFEEIFNHLNIKIKYKRLFLAAYTSLKSISEGHTHHLLVYANNTKHAKKIRKFIKLLILNKYFTIESLYYSDYSGDMTKGVKNKTLKNFETSKLGIIVCVYCLSEGYDFKGLSGVVISENMTSEIRIVQAILRANRKYDQEPDKRAKILIPMFDNDDWDDSKKEDYNTVRKIIDELSKEDTMVHQKIKVCSIGEHTEKCEKEQTKDENNTVLGEYNEELTNILKLKITKRISLGLTYEKAKKILKGYKLKNQEEYYNVCDIDCRLYKNPEEIYGLKFKGWIDYLSIEKACYTLEECKEKVIEYLEKYPELKTFRPLKITEKLCKLDTNFPLYGMWCHYYKVSNLYNIIKLEEDDE